MAAAALEMAVVLILVGAWLGALFGVREGKRSGLIALYDLILYSPIPYGWPLVQIMVVVMLVLAVLAMAALALQMRQPGR